MSYTRPWDETKPVGSTTQASDLDAVVQQLKQDIRERMNTVVADWTADPISLKSLFLLFSSGPTSITGTTDARLTSYTLPGGKLSPDGRQLQIHLYGSVILGATVYVKFGSHTISSNIIASVASPGQGFDMAINLVRVAPAVQFVVATYNTFTSSVTFYEQPNLAEDLNSDVLIDFRAIGTDVGSNAEIFGASVVMI